MYYLVKDDKSYMAYYETLGIAIGEWNGEIFNWEEDICIFGNIIGEFETEEDLIKAYKEVIS